MTGGEEGSLKFPSEAWFARFVEELNKNRDYEESAKKWEGDFLFIVNTGPELEKEAVCYMDLHHGKCREWALLPDRNARKAEYIVEGPYQSWRSLIMGELEPMRAIMGRKLKLTGSMMKVMRNVNATSELAKNCRKVPTAFL